MNQEEREMLAIRHQYRKVFSTEKGLEELDSSLKNKKGTILQRYAYHFGWNEVELKQFIAERKQSFKQTTKSRCQGFSEKGSEEDGFVKFVDWYWKQEQKCCYCGVKSEHLKYYFNEDNEQYQNARKRGKTLEIERLITAPTNVYNKNNCALACYICNNAKSEFISPEDFKPIAQGINQFWQNVLSKKGIDISYLTDFKSIWEKVEKKLNNQK